MHADLETRRRVLLLTYQRYLDADRAWVAAQRDALAWFPPASATNKTTIGSPGSMMRRLYDQRDHARLRLETAHAKLETAKRRLNARQQNTKPVPILSLTYIRTP